MIKINIRLFFTSPTFSVEGSLSTVVGDEKGSLSTVVGDEKLTSREDLIGLLFFYV